MGLNLLGKSVATLQVICRCCRGLVGRWGLCLGSLGWCREIHHRHQQPRFLFGLARGTRAIPWAPPKRMSCSNILGLLVMGHCPMLYHKDVTTNIRISHVSKCLDLLNLIFFGVQSQWRTIEIHFPSTQSKGLRILLCLFFQALLGMAQHG